MTTPFGNAIALQKWLHDELEVPEDAAAAASPWLWKEGWFRESKAFIGADAQQLSGLAPGLANSIYQRLLPWQQQQARAAPPAAPPPRPAQRPNLDLNSIQVLEPLKTPPSAGEALGGEAFNVIKLAKATLDCSNLFAVETIDGGRKEYRLCRNQSNGLLQLQALNPLRVTHTMLREEFLPTKIFVRKCMQEIFNKIVQANDPHRYAVVFGSPGVGKSVLSFLAALCCARYYTDRPVLFLRKTKKASEKISVFWIKASETQGELEVEFDRHVDPQQPGNSLPHIQSKIVAHKFAEKIAQDVNYGRLHQVYLRTMCDGPVHGSVDDITTADLVTSGGYKTISDEAKKDIIPLPLSAWTLKEYIKGCRHVYEIKAAEAKKIFYVCGGNIRNAAEVKTELFSLKKQRKFIDEVIQKHGDLTTLKLALESHVLSSDEKSIDRLRAMFARSEDGGDYTVIQYIRSPLVLQLARSSLPIDEIRNGLQSAKNTGIQSLYGWHFELFGHKCFQTQSQYQADTRTNQALLAGKTNCVPFGILEGEGTGTESVKQLNMIDVYWTPSISNFANIDAAIALDKSTDNGWFRLLYCIQYTVSVSHIFNILTFFEGFFGELPKEFRETIEIIVVVFVVPDDVTFTKVVIPQSQEYLCGIIEAQTGIELKFSKRKAAAADDGSNDATMEELDDDFADDECGEELLLEEEEGGTGSPQTFPDRPPRLIMQWEKRSTAYNMDEAPLSFLRL